MSTLFRRINIKGATEEQIYHHFFPQGGAGVRQIFFPESKLGLQVYELSYRRDAEEVGEEPPPRWHINESMKRLEDSGKIVLSPQGEIKFISHIRGLEVHFESYSEKISEEIRSFVDKFIEL
jgi:hypothetical protein